MDTANIWEYKVALMLILLMFCAREKNRFN